MPSVYGGCTGKEMLCRIPVTGKRPIKLQVEGLTEGLYFENGIIKGSVAEDCEFPVRIWAENEFGCTQVEVFFKIHEDYMIQAAQENEDVWFCHSTGTKAHTKKLSNYFNAFARYKRF